MIAGALIPIPNGIPLSLLVQRRDRGVLVFPLIKAVTGFNTSAESVRAGSLSLLLGGG